MFGVLGSVVWGLLSAFHRTWGCSGLPFSQTEPTLSTEGAGGTQGEQRDSPSPMMGQPCSALGCGTTC